MKTINTTLVLDPSKKQPFTANSLRFLQESKEEDVAAIIKSIVISNLGSYSLTVPYVISGCVYDSVSLYGITAGEIFYGGKYYETTAIANDTATNIPRFVLTKTQDATADPMEFTNGDVENVHNIYKYVATDAASGGDFTAANLNYFLANAIPSRLSHLVATPYAMTGSYTDSGVTLTTPNDGITRTYLTIYKGNYEQTNSATIATADFQLIDGTNTTTYDYALVGKTFSAAGGDVKMTVNLQSLVSLSPNTTVKVRVKENSGDGTVSEQSLIMVQM